MYLDLLVLAYNPGTLTEAEVCTKTLRGQVAKSHLIICNQNLLTSIAALVIKIYNYCPRNWPFPELIRRFLT